MARGHHARARVPSGTHCATAARRYGRVILTLLFTEADNAARRASRCHARRRLLLQRDVNNDGGDLTIELAHVTIVIVGTSAAVANGRVVRQRVYPGGSERTRRR